MKWIVQVAAFALLMAISAALAQVGQIPSWPPLQPAPTAGGGCGTGVIDASAGCPLPMLGS